MRACAPVPAFSCSRAQRPEVLVAGILAVDTAEAVVAPSLTRRPLDAYAHQVLASSGTTPRPKAQAADAQRPHSGGDHGLRRRAGQSQTMTGGRAGQGTASGRPAGDRSTWPPWRWAGRVWHRGGSVTVSTALPQWMYPPRESGWEAEVLDLLNGRRCRAVRPIRWVGR